MKLENFKNGYDVTNGSLLALNEKNDCAVRAIVNAFNITYDNAHTFTAETFKRKAKKGTKKFFITLSQLGFATFDLFQDSLFPETKTYSIHPIARNNKRIGIVNKAYTHKVVNHTVKTFCSKFNKGTFIVTVSNHALTIKDGIVIDNPDMQFTGYRRIVESACEVK